MIMLGVSDKSLCSLHERCKGFSLVELMIALVIGLVISLGAFQIFFSGKQSFEQVASLGERQEALRLVVDSLSYDIRSATSFGIAGDEDQLEVFHLDKPNNSMCAGSSNYSVSYYQSDGAIYADPVDRTNPSAPASCADSGAFVIGIGDIGFTYLPASSGVIVTVTLVDDDGRLDDEVVVFRVANRSQVSEVIEFGGGV